MRRWAWICVPLAIALAAWVLLMWGLRLWTGLLIALILVCPVLMIWGLRTARPPLEPGETVPKTRGMLLDWLAPIYDRYCNAIGLDLRFRAETLRHARLKPGNRVLDVGCGTGVLTRLAQDAVGTEGTAVGIDPGPAMIAEARHNARAAGSRADFRLAAIEKLPFTDASFDVVLSSFMFHHLPPDTKRDGLREVLRVLVPGGRLVLVDVGRPANFLWWLVAWPFLLMPMTAPNLRGEVPAYISQAGFTSVEVKGHWWRIITFWTALKPMTEGG